MMRFTQFLPALLLAACTATPPPEPNRPTLPDVGADTCDGRQYQDLIGQDATALERVLIMRTVRVIRPEQAITMDFREDRINFQIDSENKIASIGCY